ncbi:hypothetical protein [Pantoea stewartii]|uniref:Uncharacterized protein n=1 Tax=Pantoea stewartii subsp. stewartii DC283 TaxID=660596 RepID=H3RLJ7_PANSE|nr:hypothetical protein [Pantoea stewartii]ARF52756.1 hypothetical protein DSJ_26465 [Pantoea stewartii subsp. stewartii DC283]EHT97710.1 hypothetical protein CKS_5571 [Pantoea stewartii subsp. stewartii DC283]KAB0554010.1 hypothetical protein F7Q90_12535 [Pantoea stewartii subsp. stewartii]
MHKTVEPLEFRFGGGNVKVEFLPKQVMVNFFGTRFDFTATQASLRERCRDEVRKAGLTALLEKTLARSRGAKK